MDGIWVGSDPDGYIPDGQRHSIRGQPNLCPTLSIQHTTGCTDVTQGSIWCRNGTIHGSFGVPTNYRQPAYFSSIWNLLCGPCCKQ